MDEVKENHGNGAISYDPKMVIGGICGSSVSDDQGTSSSLATFVKALSIPILSLGMVVALIEFIYLSFQHPDVSNIVIPLILNPILTFLADRWAQKKRDRQAKADAELVQVEPIDD